MYKIINSGYDQWDIEFNSIKVGEIRTFDGFRSKTKSVYVNEKQISNIKNQKEAITVIDNFFKENKVKINNLKKIIYIMEQDIENNSNLSSYSVQSLKNEIQKLNKELDEFKEYDLVDEL